MDIYELLENYCLPLPEVAVSIKWESNLAYTVAGKIFAIVDMELSIDGAGIAFKVPEEAFDDLTDRAGCQQAPYFAKRQWVKVAPPNAFTVNQLKECLLQSYRLVAGGLPKKQLALLQQQPNWPTAPNA